MNSSLAPIRVALITLLLLALGFGSGCGRSGPASAQLSALARDSRADPLRLSDLQGLPAWDQLHIFGPYTPVSGIETKLGFPWDDAKRFRLERRDDIHLAVFVRNQKVVHCEEWPRSQFDCTPALAEAPLLPSTLLRMDRSRALPVLAVLAK